MEGLYFARSPNPSKRWRSLINPKIIGRQPSLYSYTTPEDFYCPETVRRMLSRLRRWLHDLPSPVALLNEARSQTQPRTGESEEAFQDDAVVDQIQRWWSTAYPMG
ncbi:unnamed protein product [Echinostoma caproni]|uniref:Uncharacterized protein n=1 Tax=Echinostoma caproni TaxID=27848 RepID=A0A183ADV4_9TREM|nr:unnamed protein product [Echinostoma caproni]